MGHTIGHTYVPVPPIRGRPPGGLGVGILPTDEVKSIGPVSWAWRQLARPDFWHDAGSGHLGWSGYLPSHRDLLWNEHMRATAHGVVHNETWLLGWHSERKYDVAQAAEALEEWRRASRAPVCAPGITWDAEGQDWLTDYVTFGGPTPMAWHIHLACPVEEWGKRYEGFVRWMVEQRVLRPVVVTDVDAGQAADRIGHRKLLELVSAGLLTRHWLSAVAWSTTYDSRRREASLLGDTMDFNHLGKLYKRCQREWRHAVITHRTGPTRGLLVFRDRARDIGPSRGCGDG